MAYHGAASQKDESRHGFGLVHACYVRQIVKLIPDVVLQKQDPCFLLIGFLA